MISPAEVIEVGMLQKWGAPTRPRLALYNTLWGNPHEIHCAAQNEKSCGTAQKEMHPLNVRYPSYPAAGSGGLLGQWRSIIYCKQEAETVDEGVYLEVNADA